MGEGLPTGTEMTLIQLHHQTRPSMSDSSQNLGNLEPHCTACRQLNKLGSILPCALVALNLFHTAGLVSASSRQIFWSQILLCNFSSLSVFAAQLYFCLGGMFSFDCSLWQKPPIESDQFQGLPKLFYLPAQGSSLQDGNVSVSEETVTQKTVKKN